MGPLGPKGDTGDRGPQGIQGIQGQQGPPGPTQDLQVRTVLGDVVTIPPGQTGSSWASCASDELAIGGGTTAANPGSNQRVMLTLALAQEALGLQTRLINGSTSFLIPAPTVWI